MDDRRGHDCEKAVKSVYSYLDGQLAAEERTEIMVHLRRCRGCADAVEFERAFLLRLRSAVCAAPAPRLLVERVRELLREAAEGGPGAAP